MVRAKYKDKVSQNHSPCLTNVGFSELKVNKRDQYHAKLHKISQKICFVYNYQSQAFHMQYQSIVTESFGVYMLCSKSRNAD